MNNLTVEARLERLEKQVKRYRLASLALGAGVIALVGIAAAPSDSSHELRIQKLVIVDVQGKEAAHLQAGPHGGALSLLNKTGAAVVRAGAAEKGGKIAIADAQGSEYVELTAEELGGGIALSDKKGQKQLMKPTPAPK
jgi:hypothetical protein